MLLKNICFPLSIFFSFWTLSLALKFWHPFLNGVQYKLAQEITFSSWSLCSTPPPSPDKQCRSSDCVVFWPRNTILLGKGYPPGNLAGKVYYVWKAQLTSSLNFFFNHTASFSRLCSCAIPGLIKTICFWHLVPCYSLFSKASSISTVSSACDHLVHVFAFCKEREVIWWEAEMCLCSLYSDM